jgi:hypothetical protein
MVAEGKEAMGIRAFVFDKRSVPPDMQILSWLKQQLASEPKGDWRTPDASCKAVQCWFSEMRKVFPSGYDADPDDPYGTEYIFYPDFVDIGFAGSVAEEGIMLAWRLADKHDLRLLIEDTLLPRQAPEGERQVHIPVLDGRPARAQEHRTLWTPSLPGFRTSETARITIAVLDLSFAPFSNPQEWVRNQIKVQQPCNDPSSLGSNKLKQWIKEFNAIDLGGIHLEVKLFEQLIIVQLRPKDLDVVAQEVAKIGAKLRLGSLFCDDL